MVVFALCHDSFCTVLTSDEELVDGFADEKRQQNSSAKGKQMAIHSSKGMPEESLCPETSCDSGLTSDEEFVDQSVKEVVKLVVAAPGKRPHQHLLVWVASQGHL